MTPFKTQAIIVDEGIAFSRNETGLIVAIKTHYPAFVLQASGEKLIIHFTEQQLRTQNSFL